jgi:hypothetical protein
MANLKTKIELYLKANSKIWDDTKVSLQNDGSVDYIKTFIYDGLAQPTAEQIASYETAGNTEELLKANLSKRVYPSIGDQLDMLWHSIDQDPILKSKYFAFYEAIKSVKVKNPK